MENEPRNAVWGDDWNQVRRNWTLDDSVTFLNHGSFGAAPLPVLESQQRLRAEMERQPLAFLHRNYYGRMEESLAKVGAFLGTSGKNLAFVSNATSGINAVVKSLSFQRGDELLIADHGYGAVIRTLQWVADRTGARVVHQPIPFPSDKDAAQAELAESFLAGLTDRTRLAVVDHITSPTAMILPADRIVRVCRERGIPVMVDAAHVPGMLPVNLDRLAPDYWAGNLHKWTCAPKGAAVLYVRPELQKGVEPVVTSHFCGSKFPEEFKWTGTDDPTAFFSVPDAIEFMGSIGWARIHAHNHQLVRYGRRVISEILGTDPPVLDSPLIYGSMAVITLPDHVTFEKPEVADELSRRFYEQYRIEVPFVNFRGKAYVRISAQVYNFPAQYEQLGHALKRFFSR